MKLHYLNVFVILAFSLTCCGLSMKCNSSACGDNTDRSDMFNASGAMIGFALLYMIITGLFFAGKFERFFGLWYFLTLCVGIITASFALQCSESCSQFDESLKTSTRGVAGFTICWTILVGGFGFYKYIMSREYEGGALSKIGAGLSAFKGFIISNKEAKNIADDISKQYK